MLLFIGIILFNIVMYIFIKSANADPNFNDLGTYNQNVSYADGSTTSDISVTSSKGWLSGFDIGVFGLPWWASLFYVTFQLIIISLSAYAMIRGLS